METQTPPTSEKRPVPRALYWVPAIIMAIIGVLAIVNDRDYMEAGGNFALVVALVLLATARPEETRTKKLAIYALIAISIGLLLARILSR